MLLETSSFATGIELFVDGDRAPGLTQFGRTPKFPFCFARAV